MNERIEKLEKELENIKDVMYVMLLINNIKSDFDESGKYFYADRECGHGFKGTYCLEIYTEKCLAFCIKQNMICKALNSNRKCPVEIKNYIDETNIKIAKAQMDFMNNQQTKIC